MNYILISHGKLASGLLAAVEVILGKQEQVFAIDMYLDEETLEDKVNHLFEKGQLLDEETIVLTDIFGGSVNQKAIEKFDLEKTNIITGMNLPLILEFLMAGRNLSKDRVRQIVADTREQIKFVNDVIQAESLEDDF